MIESYSFGRMNIQGSHFSSDLIIFPDGSIQDSWWRKEGHRLQLEDIEDILEQGPQILVAGSGASGFMKPTGELEKTLADKGVELIVQPTAQAYKTFNQLRRQDKKVAGCFHLTC